MNTLHEVTSGTFLSRQRRLRTSFPPPEIHPSWYAMRHTGLAHVDDSGARRAASLPFLDFFVELL
jgi:hypothetical protein